jgi:hypothetical protein
MPSSCSRRSKASIRAIPRTERQDVRTYYVLLRLRQDPRLSWSFGYDYEDADIDDFQSLTVKASWRF